MSSAGNEKSLERLEVIRKLNGETREWANSELYRLMYKQDLYILAYERIKSHPENMTPGTDDETLDGYSLAMIEELIQEMRAEKYRCKPVRTAYIPKSNGKMRKLGMPMVRSYCSPYTLHADLVGARNLAMRTLLIRQDWMRTGTLSVCPDVSGTKAKAARLQRYAALRWSLVTSPHASAGGN